MVLTIYRGKVCQDPRNTYYPRKFSIDLDRRLPLGIFNYDFVCADYRGSKRQKDFFLRSNCLPMDCDNDHMPWKTPEDIAKDFVGVPFVVHYSRHDGVEKNGLEPAPRFHCLFPINEIKNADEYTALKRKVRRYASYFDAGALDAARFFFGTPNGRPPIVMNKNGILTLDEFMDLEGIEL